MTEVSELPRLSFRARRALCCGVPLIPVYTNGSYFKKERARVMIGKPVDPAAFSSSDRSDKENIQAVNEKIREKLLDLEKLLEERENQEK